MQSSENIKLTLRSGPCRVSLGLKRTLLQLARVPLMLEPRELRRSFLVPQRKQLYKIEVLAFRRQLSPLTLG